MTKQKDFPCFLTIPDATTGARENVLLIHVPVNDYVCEQVETFGEDGMAAEAMTKVAMSGLSRLKGKRLEPHGWLLADHTYTFFCAVVSRNQEDE